MKSFLLLCLLVPAWADDLLLNGFPLNGAPVVYEFPELKTQPTALAQFTEALRKRFPGVAIVDASAESEASLREKLPGSFLLLASLSAEVRVWPLVARPLGMKIENGVFSWRDFSAPAKDVRALFMGRNPYGAGSVMAMAAGSMNISANMCNACSYMIFEGPDLARQGVYDRDFQFHDRLKTADALADVSEFFAAVERVHPDPFDKSSEADYRRLKEQSSHDVTARAGSDGQIALEDLAFVLTYAAAALRDGHTAVEWRTAPYAAADKRLPPFRLQAENGHFYIASAKDADLAGAELLIVNGVPVAQFLAPVLDRISGETLTFRANQFAGDQEHWLWFTNVFAAGKCCALRLRNAQGGEMERTVAPLTWTDYRKLPALPEPLPRKTEVRFLESGKVAHFIYPSFRLSDDEKKKIDDVFRQVKESQATDLIIDLRGNGGGDSGMGDHILRHISTREIEQGSETQIKISPEAIADVRKHFPKLPPEAEAMISSVMGKVVSTSDPKIQAMNAMMEEPKRAAPAAVDVFDGRLWLLVDNGTYSSAGLFVNAFRDHELGKIVGYETGEPPIASGNFMSFTMKNSGFHYRVSSRKFFPVKPRPQDSRQGVTPDIRLDRVVLAPYQSEPDPAVAFILARIREKK